ncbi:DNA polymerase kappa isoform X1 [Canis lupus familiaris]|uniref:DNA polymerase kappa n=3 Tax=Canis lupus TaxID=9612 RepID=A0A8C0N3I6_CANLF|nr:DNA polymerase kappa isoform X1 [Canis lupus familiaris]XP_013967744.1 DNA polymerase kappa isoform X1 [Canis lupus familiaris]XP_013967745.1 DNA polymerase kappa isoform X1 [Canis lupus familiaris]XP_013967746.1 DNA polymerase kappa isoform X1 [Canis lupus familiaris]XP_022272493.1 DNA polymerase kappa isoform X1 [Canis lupus familiaris]XP_022272494.1 DNA polymerase kappa isoform X1 [Canis lupus familiaris]XP_025293213.1 DNA polymerase kappa isoform X1 [Canis lupus dingo]XP_025293214.1 D|eukprot:XP_013967743.1 DNA polymerase kappa isoform X1 [Canis lupus familiaris]
MDSTKEKNGSYKDDLLLRMGLNDNKAGMEGLDKDKINKIIMEATKGSRFYGNELKKEKQVNQRIENMMQQKAQITSQQLRKAQLQVDRYAMELEQSRDLNNTIVHIDMDAFYAAVEMRDNPELKDKPIAVGSMSMLSTSNYYARRFGVRAAMPGFIAKRLCPQLIIVPPNFDKYRAVSTEVKEILADYDPNFLAMSLDEAYLNITKHLQERQNWPEDKRKYFIKTGNPLENDKPRKEVNKLREHERSISPLLFDDSPPDLQSQGNPLQGNSEEEDNPQTLQNSIVFGTSAEEVVKEIRFRIEQKTTLTASAGIAPNTMLAKVCSDKNKPNGQYQVLPNRQAVMDFIKDLPIRKVSGIGKVTEKMLKALGIITCTELYQQRALLSLLFSETSWHHFLHISLGLGSTHLARDGERKSMSVERTFSEISKAEEQYNLCQELCSELAQDLQKEGLKGRTVTIKLKNVNFEVKTRASTVSSVVSTTEEIFAIAKELLRTEIDADFPHPLRLRLMGVRLSSFPNEEDKRHQQRSIIGFLQAGNQSQSAPGCILEKTDKDQFLKSLEMSHKKSFFDKKRSERNWSHQDTFKCEAVDKQSLQTSHSFQVLKKKMNENLKTSENSNNSQIFTCPICFREQRSISLEAFNKHVDACLDGPSISGISSVFSHSHASSTEVNKKENVYPSFSQSEKQDYETHQRNSEINFIELPETEDNPAKAESVDALSDKHSKEECASLPSKPFNIEKCCQNSSSTVSLEDIASLSRQESSQPYLQALVCPVCNLEQKTSDLTLFNVHVDVCLNKGIIQELRKDKVNLANQPRENTKSTDNSGRVQKTATKPKRPGLMTKYSASKKTKPNNSRHTLDVFFK